MTSLARGDAHVHRLRAELRPYHRQGGEHGHRGSHGRREARGCQGDAGAVSPLAHHGEEPAGGTVLKSNSFPIAKAPSVPKS